MDDLKMEIHKAYIGDVLITDEALVEFEWDVHKEVIVMKMDLAKRLYSLINSKNEVELK